MKEGRLANEGAEGKSTLEAFLKKDRKANTTEPFVDEVCEVV